MASSGYLVSPHKDPSKEKLWSETWKRIDRFLPELRGELALDEPPNKENTNEQTVDAPAQSQDTGGEIKEKAAESTESLSSEESEKEDETSQQ
jgi:brefeldin A-resistance guanine nucleotide exchange factor 1